MSSLFQNVLNLTPVISVMIIAVIIMRIVFANAPKRLNKILWAIIGIRCCLPFSFSSPAGLLPDKAVPYAVSNQGIKSTGMMRPEIIMPEGEPGSAVNAGLSLEEVLPYIWLAGIIVFLAYMAVRYIRVRHLVSDSIPCGNGIYEADKVSSSFVLGFLKPRIYLKAGISGEKRDLIIAHERCHIKNGDNLVKLAGFIILGIYWFNPLMWAAYVILCKDIELACDEEVVKGLPSEKRKDYAIALLESSHKKSTFIYAAAFSENNTKERVIRIMNYKKATLKVVCIAAAVCLAFLVVFFTVSDKGGVAEGELPDENPGYFETESISVEYDVENFFGYMSDGTIILNSTNAVAGTSLIQIAESGSSTIEEALSEIASTTGFELTEAEKCDLNGYNAVRVHSVIPDGEYGVVIDDTYTVVENNGKVIVIDEMVTRDNDSDRAKKLEKEFSETIGTITFIQ